MTERTPVLDRQTSITKPKQYAVVLLNDDYTPMDWVVLVLIGIFNRTAEDAADITNQVHTQGRGVANVYQLDIAETKAAETMAISQYRGHPLKAVVEAI